MCLFNTCIFIFELNYAININTLVSFWYDVVFIPTYRLWEPVNTQSSRLTANLDLKGEIIVCFKLGLGEFKVA